MTSQYSPKFSAPYWRQYFESDVRITSREYEALGVWAVLDEMDGVALWEVLPTLYRNHQTSDEFLDALVGVGGPDYLGRLATTLLNDRRYGDEWGLASAPATITPTVLALYDLGSPVSDRVLAPSPRLVRASFGHLVAANGGLIRLTIGDVSGAVLWTDGSEAHHVQPLDGRGTYPFCFGAPCACITRVGGEPALIDVTGTDGTMFVASTAWNEDLDYRVQDVGFGISPEAAICAELHPSTVYVGECEAGAHDGLVDAWCSYTEGSGNTRTYVLVETSTFGRGGTDVCVYFHLHRDVNDDLWTVDDTTDCYGLAARRTTRRRVAQPDAGAGGTSTLALRAGGRRTVFWGDAMEGCPAPDCVLYTGTYQPLHRIELHGGGPWTAAVLLAPPRAIAPGYDSDTLATARMRCEAAAALDPPAPFDGFHATQIVVEVSMYGWIETDHLIDDGDGVFVRDWVDFRTRFMSVTERTTWLLRGDNPGGGCPSRLVTTTWDANY